MTEHRLKCWPEYFREIASGKKPFDVRKADRDFQVGDTVVFEEWLPIRQEYTGNVTVNQITCVLRGFEGLKKGYCILGLEV